MQISRIVLKHFRCFESQEFLLEAPTVLIQGPNGSGKTTLLEALHYACYLRSFRTYGIQELVMFDQDVFFIGLSLLHEEMTKDISLGISHKKRSVKIDQRPVTSFKELLEHFRVVTVTERDLGIINESPHERRAFVDQALMLHDPEYAGLLRTFKQTVHNRNALLQHHSIDPDLYTIWTDKLLDQSHMIKTRRAAYLTSLEEHINTLLSTFISSSATVQLSYHTKYEKDLLNTHDIETQMPRLKEQERALGRSLYGAHLDDINILFSGFSSRHFASRGQQKLTILLIKVAQLSYLMKEIDKGAVLLVDDFMTDFDEQVASDLVFLLSSFSIQRIFTSPVRQGPLEGLLSRDGAHKIILKN